VGPKSFSCGVISFGAQSLAHVLPIGFLSIRHHTQGRVGTALQVRQLYLNLFFICSSAACPAAKTIDVPKVAHGVKLVIRKNPEFCRVFFLYFIQVFSCTPSGFFLFLLGVFPVFAKTH
jgi:hypothetical protein